jgi:hypothetical protein
MQDNSAYIYASDDNWNSWNLEGTQTSLFCLQQKPFEIINAEGICLSNMAQEVF